MKYLESLHPPALEWDAGQMTLTGGWDEQSPQWLSNPGEAGGGEGPGQDFSGRAAVLGHKKSRMQQELQELSPQERQAVL